MDEERKYKPSILTIVIDYVGMVLVGFGLFEWLSGSSLMPEQYKFAYYYVAMIGLGVLFIIPYFWGMYNYYHGGKSGPNK